MNVKLKQKNSDGIARRWLSAGLLSIDPWLPDQFFGRLPLTAQTL